MDVSKLMFRDGLMAGERILVTGGGTGLGREMAEAFLKLGATVYICGRRQNKLDETAAELTALHGGKIVGLACDIRDPDAIHAMVDAIWADGGALTGVVNNAAGVPMAPHINVSLFARGINIHLQTRLYFDDEAEANAQDPVLNLIEQPQRRETLIAKRCELDGKTAYRFDIRIQGEGETVFFDF